MISVDDTEITINHIDRHKVPEMHPRMLEMLNANDVHAKRDERTGEWIIQGIDKRMPPKLQSKGKRKNREDSLWTYELIPPGRITGVTKKAPFDVLQVLPLTDSDHPNSPKMKWLFYWMLMCLPKDRLIESSMKALIDLYHFEEPEGLDIMRGVFISMMTRVEDIQLLVSCGQFPPYSFLPISHFELVTVSLGRITDSQEVNEETQVVKQRRSYESGFRQFTLKYVTGSIDSSAYVKQISHMVERGGVHGLFETIVAEQTEIFERNRPARLFFSGTSTFVNPLEHVPPSFDAEFEAFMGNNDGQEMMNEI